MSISTTYSNYTSLFYSSSSSSDSTSSTSLLSDYASIKNGSYKKLLDAYYTKQESEASSDSGTTKTSLVLLQQNAIDLKTAADALAATGSDSLFEKVDTKTTDETTGVTSTTSDYDYDSLYEAATELVEAYNSILEASSEQSSSLVTKKTDIITSYIGANSSLLSDAGITINGDNSLSIDEEDFKQADISTLKTLFNGSNSLSSYLSSKASSYFYSAQNLISALSGSSYTSSGSYTALSTGSLIDSLT